MDNEYDELTAWSAPNYEKTLTYTTTFVQYAGRAYRVIGYYEVNNVIRHFILKSKEEDTLNHFDPYTLKMESYMTVSHDFVKILEGDPEQLELLYG